MLLLTITLAWFAWYTPPAARSAIRRLRLVPLTALTFNGALARLAMGVLLGLAVGVMAASHLWLWQGILRGVLGPVGDRWRPRRR